MRLSNEGGFWLRGDRVWLIDTIRDDCRVVAEVRLDGSYAHLISAYVLPYIHLPTGGWRHFELSQNETKSI